MPDSQTVYNKIIESRAPSAIAVFDLDSTLYNVSHRTQKIIEDFAQEPKYKEAFPVETELLKSVKIAATDWGLRESLQRTQANVPQAFFTALRDYWEIHFFSSEYLKYDLPYEGTVEYVNSLQQHGIQIYYLTGRDEPNMLKGTLESLEKFGFPLKDAQAHLFMKAKKGISEDEDFKADTLHTIKSRAEKVWFFENEPVIINKVAKVHPNLNIVWINTTHSRREEPPAEILTIGHRWRY